MASHPLFTQGPPSSGALLRPSPENPSPGRAVGSKRPAEEEIEGPRRAAQRASPPADGPRKVHAPGATAAALARLAELRAQGGGARSGSPSPPPPASASKKVPAPGATAAALARLSSLNSGSSGGSGGGAALPSPLPVGPPSSAGKKVHAPGATAAALARLASMKGGPPGGGGAGFGGHPGQLPPPPRPLFGRAPAGAGAPAAGPAPAAPAPADLAVGALVWAKMASYPWWPAQVQRPSGEQARLKHGAGDVFVVFYGTADYTWIGAPDLRPFRASAPEYARFAGAKNKQLQRAIDAAWVNLGQPRPDVGGRLLGGVAPAHPGHARVV